MNKIIFTLSFFLSLSLSAQRSSEFQFQLEPVNIPGLPGLQSYAFGQYQGQWLILGGRLDGLHQRQPRFSFDEAGHNDQIYLVDPQSQSLQNFSIQGFNANLRAQLRATNLQFYQKDSLLYLVGGYGIHPSTGQHQSHPYLCVVDLPGLFSAAAQNQNLEPYFHQVTHQNFAVTGGYLAQLQDLFLLVGGHRFDGRYNPMNGPSFTQSYTNAARPFRLSGSAFSPLVQWLPEIVDSALLHRRDYNVAPSITPQGDLELISFAGPFQYTANIPFLNIAHIDSQSVREESGFAQYYHHYHCPKIGLYDSLNNAMHHVFFGGMAQYYDSAGLLIQDDEVPFVESIARVSRDANGQYREELLPQKMPGLLGSGAEFIPLPGLALAGPKILDLQNLVGDSLLIGHIYGGIESSARNIFFVNNGSQSQASDNLYAVYLLRGQALGQAQINPQSHDGWQLQIFPNPTEGFLQLQLYRPRSENLSIQVYDQHGRLMWKEKRRAEKGPNRLNLKLQNLPQGMYHLQLSAPDGQSTQQRLILR